MSVNTKREMKYFTLVELAHLFQVRRHNVVAWVNRGCPYIQRADRAKGLEWQFDLSAVVQWHVQEARLGHEVEHEAPDEGEELVTVPVQSEHFKLEEAKRRKIYAEAELAELQLAKVKGELIERQVVKQTLLELAQQEYEAWQNWPDLVHEIIANELNVEPQKVLAVLEKYVTHYLTERINPMPKI